MPRIQVLPDLLVNKIAAGEVIERPASVVKELVENSLDAGARRVDIDIEQGGRKLIRVVDDGGGMDADDLALAVQPHATSKVRTEDDLFQIRTMGFRGEALPSIGAVSQLRIVSRPTGAEAAHEIRVSGDRMEPVVVAAGPPGTGIEIRELFFNVPARQKFLRSPQTEVGHITEQLARIALVHPEVEFRLTHNGRLVHHLRPAAGMRSRIADFYGRELADGLLEINRDERGLRIAGYAARPAESRSSAKWQYLFLNGRFIRDRFIGHAVREAYRGLIDPHRHPVVFLAFEIDPGDVDVNVHPTKVEVRWRDSNAVYTQVLSALRDRFLNADLTPALSTDKGGAHGHGPGGDAAAAGSAAAVEGSSSGGIDDEAAEARRQQIRASIADFFKRVKPTTSGLPNLTDGGGGTGVSPVQSGGAGAGPAPTWDRLAGGPPPGSGDPSAFQGASSGANTDSPIPAEMFTVDPQAAAPGPTRIDNVIQVHRTYLVAETPDGLVIVDQHALHERVLFEELSAQLARGPLESQRLLIPDTLDVSPDQLEVIEAHAERLQQLGFELSPYGPRSIAVHAAPTLLKDDRVLDFLRDMLDRLSVQAGPASTEMLTNDLLSMMACKAAVKAGDPLSLQEIQALMSRRGQVERSSNCPHGRPTSLRLTVRDLERQFKRT